MYDDIIDHHLFIVIRKFTNFHHSWSLSISHHPSSPLITIHCHHHHHPPITSHTLTCSLWFAECFLFKEMRARKFLRLHSKLPSNEKWQVDLGNAWESGTFQRTNMTFQHHVALVDEQTYDSSVYLNHVYCTSFYRILAIALCASQWRK